MATKEQMSFTDILKNIFFLFLIIQLATPIFRIISKQYHYLMRDLTPIGVLTIKGVLYDSSSYCKRLNLFFKDPHIKAILIKMECPGGASGTSQTIFQELLALKQSAPKPIIVLVENVCASGGYNIACAADYIIAPGSAIIGSIGTSLPYLFNIKELLEDHKVKYTPISSGIHKNATNPFVPMSEEDKRLLQEVTNDAYDQFILEVSQQRKLPLNTAHIWAEGKIFTAKQAQKLGLIDGVGSLHTAITIIKKKAGIQGEIEWIKPRTRTSIWTLFSGDNTSDYDDSVFSRLINHLYTYLQTRYNAHMIL